MKKSFKNKNCRGLENRSIIKEKQDGKRKARRKESKERIICFSPQIIDNYQINYYLLNLFQLNLKFDQKN